MEHTKSLMSDDATPTVNRGRPENNRRESSQRGGNVQHCQYFLKSRTMKGTRNGSQIVTSDHLRSE